MKKHGRGIESILANWYAENDVKKILDFIGDRAQNEIGWMQDILGQASLPSGRTPRQIMQWNTTC